MAAAVETAPSMVSEWESGASVPTLQMLGRLMDYYDIGLSEMEDRLAIQLRKRSRIREALEAHEQRIAALEGLFSRLPEFLEEEGGEP